MGSSSCCASFIKFLMIACNTILLLLGIALVVLTALAKWTNTLSVFQSVKGLSQLINVASIEAIAIALLCIGGFCILLSILGIFGVCCSNKCFLILYEIIVVLLFLAHITAFILIFVFRGKIEEGFKKQFEDTLTKVKATQAPYQSEDVNTFKGIAVAFECCGVNGKKDFDGLANELLNATCPNSAYYATGCGDAVINKLKKNSVYFLIIPSAILLAIEFCAIIVVPILISNINKSKSLY